METKAKKIYKEVVLEAKNAPCGSYAAGCRVNYGDGITRRLDTVVRQNMAYGIKQSHKEYNELVGREIGADGIMTDYPHRLKQVYESLSAN